MKQTHLVVLAPEQQAEFDDCPLPLHLRLADCCFIHFIQHASGEPSCPSVSQTVSELYDDLEPVWVAEFISSVKYSINWLQTTSMTDEKRALPLFTCNCLKKLSNWSDWDPAYGAPLNDHFDSDTFGKAISCPTPIAGCPPNVLWIHWANDVKIDGHL